MKRIFTLRSLVAVCLATLCSFLTIRSAAAATQESPQATKSVATANMWLEEGYTWTYTCRLCTDPGWEPIDDFVKTYRLEAPVDVNGISYFPLMVKFNDINGGVDIPNFEFQLGECPNEYIIGYLRQDVNDGLIYYCYRDADAANLHQKIYLIQYSQTAIWDKLKDYPEYPIWLGSDYESKLYGTDLTDVSCSTLVGSLSGKRFMKNDWQAAQYEDENHYVAYVEGLGRVGVTLDGKIAPRYTGDLLGTIRDDVSGWNDWNMSMTLLYSIQRGDGTYLVLNKENVPKRATDSVEGVGADASGVTVSTGHNILTVTAAAPAEVTVSDLAGRVVAKATVNGEQQFSLGAGIYLLTIDGHTCKIAVK